MRQHAEHPYCRLPPRRLSGEIAASRPRPASSLLVAVRPPAQLNRAARRRLARGRMLRPLASPSRPRRLEVVHPGVAGDLLAERRRLLVGGADVEARPDAGFDQLADRVREAVEVVQLAW